MEIQGLSEAWNTLEKEIKQIKQIYICLKSQLHDLNVERNLNTSGKDTDNNIDNNIHDWHFGKNIIQATLVDGVKKAGMHSILPMRLLPPMTESCRFAWDI